MVAVALPTIASVAGAAIKSGSASDAADAQQAAADKAAEVQKYMYDTSRADLAPFRSSGVAANRKLSDMLGLAPDRDSIGASLKAKHPELYGDKPAETSTPRPLSSMLTSDGMYQNYKTGTGPAQPPITSSDPNIGAYKDDLAKAYTSGTPLPSTASYTGGGMSDEDIQRMLPQIIAKLKTQGAV